MRAIWDVVVEMGPRDGHCLVRIGHFTTANRLRENSRMQEHRDGQTHGPGWSEGLCLHKVREIRMFDRTGLGAARHRMVGWDSGERFAALLGSCD